MFRNKRRKSDAPLPSGSKLVSIPNAKPSQPLSSNHQQSIPGAFDRNHARLIKEFEQKNPNQKAMIQLLKETFPECRKAIETAQKKTTEILKEYPYFAKSTWVISPLHVHMYNDILLKLEYTTIDNQ